MNNTKHIAIVLLLFISLVFESCSDWLDINTNPNVPSEVGYKELLPSGISSVAYVLGGRYQVLGALWSQHYTQSPGASQYAGIDSYDINSSSFDENQFGELYAGGLKNLEEVRMAAFAEKQWKFYLAATVMQAYTYQLLVDLYDQIPFSQALKGDKGITEPRYEAGNDIYDSLIARIDYALAQDLDADNLEELKNYDILFNGNIERWIEFANTLKLRIFLRQSSAKPDKAEAGIRKLYNEKASFLANDAKLNLFTDESGRRNPVYETDINFFGQNPNLILSHTLYSYFIEVGDFTRLDYLFFKPGNGGGHKALEQGNYYAPGEPSGINSNSYSKPVLYSEDPVYLMSLSESFLLQSEAIIRYQVNDYQTARELYNDAVKSSYNRIVNRVYLHQYNSTTSTENLSAPMLAGPYSFPAEGSSVEAFMLRIHTEKWIALSGIQNLEVFFEQNRTGIPKRSTVTAADANYKPGEWTVSVNNVTSAKFPRRLVFPESEYSGNRNTPTKKEVWELIWWQQE